MITKNVIFSKTVNVPMGAPVPKIFHSSMISSQDSFVEATQSQIMYDGN